MQTIRRSYQRVIGVQVEAPFAELADAVAPAWEAVFARVAELPALADGAFVQHSEDVGAGRGRETVGAFGDVYDLVPDGMASAEVPAGGWVHHRQAGPAPPGFQAICDWAQSEGIRLGRFKLDVGRSADAARRPHDLYIVIEGEETR